MLNGNNQEILKLVNAGYKKTEIESICKKDNTIYYKKYYNSRFGFSFLYPSSLLTLKELPSNGDGVKLFNRNHTAELIANAYFSSDDNIKKIYKDEINYLENSNKKITYKALKKNWFVISGIDYSKNQIFYEKRYLINGILSGFIFKYPISKKNIYDKTISKISHSFKPSKGG